MEGNVAGKKLFFDVYCMNVFGWFAQISSMV